MLIPELASMGKIPMRLISGKRTQTIHIGRGPGQMQEISESMRLLALNEALTETLQREDYEQAALLRDQIKALTDKQQEKNDDGRSP
jgi:protein arginine kinase activator